MIAITNTSEKIIIENGNIVDAITKNCISRISKNKSKGEIIIYYNSPEKDGILKIKYDEVNSPSTSNINDLYTLLNEYADYGRAYIVKKVAFTIANANAQIELGDFSNYQQVSVEIDYNGIDDVDATVKLQQKINASSSEYVDITGLSTTLDAVGGTGIEVLQDDAFGSGLLAAYFTKNSVTEGHLNFKIIAHKTGI